MKALLITFVLILVALAPQFVDVVARQAWPMAIRKVAASALVLVFAGTVVYAFLSAERRDPVWLRATDIVVAAFLAWGLFTAYRDWPSKRKPDSAVGDKQENVSRAIAAMELWLGLSATERLEKQKPEQGVWNHRFVHYSDGSWVEWLYPMDEKGEPDFSYCAVYSNRQDIVAFLSDLIGGHSNVERTDKPLWHKRL